MDEQIIATYCLCDDLLKAMHHHADAQCKMSDAEVMTTALTAALFFRGTLESARMMLKQYGYIPQMLSKSHFRRRLHRLKETFLLLFQLLGAVWKKLNAEAIYVIDSLPIAVCDNIRISRAKLYAEDRFRGYLPSKKRYFYGLKLRCGSLPRRQECNRCTRRYLPWLRALPSGHPAPRNPPGRPLPPRRRRSLAPVRSSRMSRRKP
jgi:hypothetical protein